VVPDNHVHTEWSWDADAGSMARSCARAEQLGLPSIAFTEHVDLTRWVAAAGLAATLGPQRLGEDGRVSAPPLDVDGYLECIADCRRRFPDLRILTGVELGEPHWFSDHTRTLLDGGRFDRVLGSLHSIRVGDDAWLMDEAFGPQGPVGLAPEVIMRAYLADAVALASSTEGFEVFAHIDYPARHWPAEAGPFDAHAFEDEHRELLLAIARSGRALEINTRLPLAAIVLEWWRDAGGAAVSFGSDAHRPSGIAAGFKQASQMAESYGFGPGRHPHDLWVRR
jgi:histidinol-phosphatase (PHP family)